jgi:uncharacterized membrane protein
MPFCCKCGTNVSERDVFCARCGARQPVFASATANYINGISPRTASLLCYIPFVGWIAAIVVLATARFRGNHTVRFHAFQGLYLFVAWLLVSLVLAPVFAISFFTGGSHVPYFALSGLFKLVIFCTWIFMMVKVSQDDHFKLPVLGELAEKSVSEQR